MIRKNNEVPTIKSLQRNLCPFEKKRESPPLPLFSLSFYIFMLRRRCLVRISVRHHRYQNLSLTRQTSGYVPHIANYDVFIAFLASKKGRMIFSPFNFGYESSCLTRVTVRNGNLRIAVIAVENLRHLPPISSLCACVCK